MKHLLKKSAVIAAALASLGSAQAAVITFESPALNSSGAVFAPLISYGDELVEAGFLVAGISNAAGAGAGDLVGALVNGSDLAATCVGVVCPSNNATTFYAGVNDGYMYLAEQTDSNKPFTIAGFKASFLANGVDPIPTVGGSGLLRIQGVKADGSGSLTQTFTLAPGNASGQLSFSSYLTTGAFATTQFKYAFIFGFYCDTTGACTNAFTNDKGQFAIDDINVSLAGAVPEPASWGLMGLGLAGMAAFVRRRRS